jgi:hypothetical protein
MPAVPVIVDAAIAAIASREAITGSPPGALERNLRLGLTDAVDRWFDAEPRPQDAELHAALGRAQARAGRSLDELMGFYRTAAQTMWRRLTEIAVAEGAEPGDIYVLAETGFGCVDELSSQAAAGFADEQSHRSGASHLRRSELLRLLLADPVPGIDVLYTAARAAGVELAATVAFFVGPADDHDAFTRTARGHVLLGPREGEFVGALFDPDAPGRRRQLASAAQRAGARLALGLSVPLVDARRSLDQAHRLLSLMRDGLIERTPLAQAAEHDVELLLNGSPDLGEAIVRRRLAPLDSIAGEVTRGNLTLTLSEWLAHPGQRKTIAHNLGVHPQTVRYRVTRLRELFGTALDDPDERFELQLALRLSGRASRARSNRGGAASPTPRPACRSPRTPRT